MLTEDPCDSCSRCHSNDGRPSNDAGRPDSATIKENINQQYSREPQHQLFSQFSNRFVAGYFQTTKTHARPIGIKQGESRCGTGGANWWTIRPWALPVTSFAGQSRCHDAEKPLPPADFIMQSQLLAADHLVTPSALKIHPYLSPLHPSHPDALIAARITSPLHITHCQNGVTSFVYGPPCLAGTYHLLMAERL